MAMSQETTSVNSLKESALLHIQLDRQGYVLGEYLWYKVYLLEAQDNITLRIIYVDLFDTEGKKIQQHVLPITAASVHGGIFLSPDWKAGTYAIVAYQATAKKPDSLVFNKLLFPVLAMDTTAQAPLSYNSNRSDDAINYEMGIEVAIQPSIYTPRALVEVGITATDNQGRPVEADVSLAVRRKPDSAYFYPPSIPPNSPDNIADKHFSINNPSPIPYRISSPHDISEEISIALWQTDSLRVKFLTLTQHQQKVDLQPFYGEQTLQVFPLQSQLTPLEPEIKLLTDLAQIAHPNSSTIYIDYAPFIRSFQIQSKKRQLVRQLFDIPYEVSQPLIYSSRKALDPDVVFNPDEYIQFETLADFFQETVHIKLKERKTTTDLKLLSADNNLYFKQPPIFLVNGYLTRDIEAVLAIPWREIKYISLFLSEFRLLSQFAGLGENGVCRIETRSDKAIADIIDQSTILAIQGYTLPSVYSPPDYGKDTISTTRTPDFRTIEYWQPHIHTDTTGSASVRFYTSDALGEFEIYVEGVSTTGATGRQVKPYTVIIAPN